MKLSLWHCEILYVMTRLSIEEVIKTSGLQSKVLIHAAKLGNWQWKKGKFSQLSSEQQNDLDVIELLVGDFKHDQSHLDFVNLILAKLKEKQEKKQPTKEDIKNQYIARLSEYGMDESVASDLIKHIESELIGVPSESDLVNNVVSQTVAENAITVKDKIDTVNVGYKYLVDAHDANASHIHDDLRKRIDFFAGMIDKLQTMMPDNISFEELAQLQRTISYAATSYGKLIQLQYEIGGLKGYVNHHSSVAKLFGQGYMVMQRDEMGRLINATGEDGEDGN